MPALISKPNFIAMIVATAFFMYNLDSTIVATALPQMAISFGESPIRLSIAIVAYLLALAVFIPVSGWLSDRYGARTIFRAAIGIFTLGSLLCGISNSLIQLVAARILQGVGASMMVPVGRLVVLRAAPKSAYVRATAFLQVPAQIGPVLGPLIGGFIATYASWRWIFLVNLPIGILGMVLASLYIENYRETERRPLDWLGFVMSGIALASIMYAIESIARGTADAVSLTLFLGIGFGSGAFAIWHARRHAHPLIDLSLLRIPTFGASFWGGSFFRIGAGALPFLLPLLFQVAFGMTAFASGLLTFVSALGAISMRLIARITLKTLGFRRVVIGNAVISALSVFVCGFFTPATPQILILGILLVGGFFRSLQYTSLNALAYCDIPPPRMSGATSLAQLIQQLGAEFGIAAASTLLHFSLSLREGTQLALPDFIFAFTCVSVASLGSLLFLARLAPDAGAEVSGHQPRPAMDKN